MSNWSHGYFTETNYTYGYYREISPAFLKFCLLLRGYDILPFTAESCHCELGFGQGVSVNVHAASNEGRYVATDFNATQTLNARILAGASGAKIALYDNSFEELCHRTDLPQFDTICLHGIWTWISKENQKIIVEFARRYLKPGGIFYVSYNCFPGWAPAHPLRHLFREHYKRADATLPADQRIGQALDFAKTLVDAHPLYAAAVPTLTAKLEQLSTQSKDYLGHEYFNADWNCIYFTEMAETLAEAKLEFATSANPLDYVETLNLSPEAQTFLDGVKNPVFREQLRDYFVNTQFRKDIFLRGARKLTPYEQASRLLETRVALISPVENISLTVKGARGEATMHEHVYKPLLQVLAGKAYAPKTLRELVQALPDIGLPALVSAITILTGAGHVHPCHQEKPFLKTCKALNQHIIEQAEYAGTVHCLASPVLGGAISMNRFQLLFCMAMQKGHKQPADWAHFVWQILSNQGQKLVKEGVAIESKEETLKELTEQATLFATQQLPIIKALQVL